METWLCRMVSFRPLQTAMNGPGCAQLLEVLMSAVGPDVCMFTGQSILSAGIETRGQMKLLNSSALGLQTSDKLS
jgi:hypothetical protein